jgi:sodium-dependent dicarboxylate transporter 2/3/5
MGTKPVFAPAPKPEAAPRPKFTRLHGLIVAILIGLLFYLLPTGLPAKGHLALAISVFTVAMWVCNVLAIEMTAILFSVLIAVFKVLPPPRAFAGFADVTPWFMVAVLLFGLAVTETGLGTRLSLNLAKIFGTSFSGLTIALMITGFILSFLTPAGAERVLICYPLAIGTGVAIMGASMKDSNVTKFSLSVAYIAGNTFGFGILTGTSANMVALGVIKQVTGVSLFWMQWAKWFFVPCTLTTLISIYILYKMYPPERTHVEGGQSTVHQQLVELGPISPRELKTLLYLGLALLFWITDTWHHIPPWAIAVFAAVLMNAPRIGCLEIADLKKIPYSICLFSAGTISLGIVMSETGVSTWLGKATLGHLIKPGMSTSVTSAITFLVSAVLHFPLMESKTALAGLVPVVAGYFHGVGLPFLGPTLLCAIRASASRLCPSWCFPPC